MGSKRAPSHTYTPMPVEERWRLDLEREKKDRARRAAHLRDLKARKRAKAAA